MEHLREIPQNDQIHFIFLYFGLLLSSIKSLAQTKLRLSLALFFISPAAPVIRQPVKVYFSAAAQLYMKIEHSRQCQHKLAVSV